MTIVKASTKRGQRVLDSATNYQGTKLIDIYTRWSQAKQNAYDDCIDDYRNTPEHSDFRICGHNCNFFSVSWYGLYNNDRCIYYRTGKTEYIILLDK